MKHIKLFESKAADSVYDKSLEDGYWKTISKKFPEYNSPVSKDFKEAVAYILGKMKEKYPYEKWDKIEKSVRRKIEAGLT